MNSPIAPAPRIVILTATDGTEASEDAIRTSAMLARRFDGSELHLLHVLEPPPAALDPSAALTTTSELLDHARILMDRATDQARGYFEGKLATHIVVGEAVLEILQLASDLQADVVVVGSHRKRMVERWVLGSVSEEVVRKASCAVIVARPKTTDASAVPEIEPPCPDCLATQRASGREKLWCTRHEHGRTHARGHLHYEFPPTFAVGSMLLRPEE